ncbi:DUF3558 domain-containing protein [Nocardia halotolerans]|uniref:DUF3558 domain-containing protein n=1 Tax=Nocardia halotolerans TaxID=1755878 RepID=A0ABV8VN70_9NOCA
MQSTTAPVLIAALALALGACTSTSDQPDESTTSAATALWNPCTEIAPDHLRQMGIDADTKTSTTTEKPDWKYCTWQDSKAVWAYHLGILSTSFPLEAIRKAKPSATETTVGGRTGIQDRTADRECEILLPAGTGSVYIRASDSPAAHNPPDPCTRALEAANVLVTGLP